MAQILGRWAHKNTWQGVSKHCWGPVSKTDFLLNASSRWLLVVAWSCAEKDSEAASGLSRKVDYNQLVMCPGAKQWEVASCDHICALRGILSTSHLWSQSMCELEGDRNSVRASPFPEILDTGLPNFQKRICILRWLNKVLFVPMWTWGLLKLKHTYVYAGGSIVSDSLWPHGLCILPGFSPLSMEFSRQEY